MEIFANQLRRMVRGPSMVSLQLFSEMSIRLLDPFMKVSFFNIAETFDSKAKYSSFNNIIKQYININLLFVINVFIAFLLYNWDEDLRENLMDPFRNGVQRKAAGTYCGTKYNLLANPLENSIKDTHL